MPYPNAHLYLRINGNFGVAVGTNEEKWSAGLRLGIIGADVPMSTTGLQTFADAVHGYVKTAHALSAAYTSASCHFVNVSVARVGTDGLYNPSQQKTVFSAGATGSGAGLDDQPWNTAGVISLRTDNYRGYASNGRFYYPQLAGQIDPTTGRVLASALNQRLSTFQNLFNQINIAAAAYAANMRILVSSKTGGTAAIVRAIRIDERLDSIERRENAAATVWRTGNLAP